MENSARWSLDILAAEPMLSQRLRVDRRAAAPRSWENVQTPGGVLATAGCAIQDNLVSIGEKPRELQATSQICP